MNRFVNAVVIGLAVFLVAVTAVWLLVQSEGGGAVDVAVEDVAWTGNGTTLRADLSISNDFSRTALLQGLTYEVRLEDSVLFEGRSNDTMEIRGGRDGSAVVESDLPGDLGARWWRIHLENDEESELTIEGEATFDVGGDEKTVAFSRAWRFMTDLTSDLQSGIETCGRDPDEPCLDDVDMEWRDGSGSGVLRYEIQVFNPYDAPLVVTGQDARLEWANMTIAEAASEGEVEIDPGETHLVAAELHLDGRMLVDWWAAHVENCESSTARVLADLPFEVRSEGGVDGNETVLRQGTLRFGSAGASISTPITCGV